MATSTCTYIFAAINRTQRKVKPIMLRITEPDEKSAHHRYAPDYILLFAGRLPAQGRRMPHLVDTTPLTSNELAFHCMALVHAALFSREAAVKEALLFILLEKTDLLYRMLPEAIAEVNHV